MQHLLKADVHSKVRESDYWYYSQSTDCMTTIVYQSGIDESLALERKIESRKRNFSLDLENLIVSISLSTLNF